MSQHPTIWLASYPRSGNTFLRTVLAQVFGIKTTSVYKGENRVFGAAPTLVERVGHFEMSGKDEQEGGWPRLVKTHDAPPDSGPAIYVVRDGRSALVSYKHYQEEVERQPRQMEDIITGKIWPGSWSEHFASWRPLQRANTLLVRYETLKHDTLGACDAIGKFIGMSPKETYKDQFAELQKLLPTFFRHGDDGKNIQEMGPYRDLFDRHHGDLMSKLGYY